MHRPVLLMHISRLHYVTSGHILSQPYDSDNMVLFFSSLLNAAHIPIHPTDQNPAEKV